MTTDSTHPHTRRPRRFLRWTPVALLATLAGAIAIAAAGPAPRERVVALGPVDLPAVAAHHGMAQPRPLRTTFGVDGRLVGYSVEVVDAEGRPVPRSVLHHVKLRAPDRRGLFSPLMLRIGAAGAETHDVRLPAPAGYRFTAGDSLLVSAMLHNPTGRSWHGVRLRVRLLWEPEATSHRWLSVMPFFMHVTPPGLDSNYDLPPGHSQRSHTLRPATRVRVLGIGGHAHRYATALRFDDLTTGRRLWTARLSTSDDGVIRRISRTFFLWRGGLPLEPDREYRVTVEYDNPHPDTLRREAMATVAGMVVLARGAKWPRVDRSDPVYRADAADEH